MLQPHCAPEQPAHVTLFTQHLQIILQQGNRTMCFRPSMLLYKVQGFNALVHAMMEFRQQACITYEMPAPYKLACTHWRQTHWRRQASVTLCRVGTPEQGSPPKVGFPARDSKYVHAIHVICVAQCT